MSIKRPLLNVDLTQFSFGQVDVHQLHIEHLRNVEAEVDEACHAGHRSLAGGISTQSYLKLS